MEFEYISEVVKHEVLDVPSVGNCVIQALDIDQNEYYLIVRTKLGRSEIVEFGPISPTGQKLLDYYFSYKCMLDYDERKLAKIIDRFLNNPMIIQAQLIEHIEEIKAKIIDPIQFYLEESKDETNN